MATIEETYAVIDKHTGRDCGLMVLRSVMDGRGIVGNEIEVVPLDGRGLPAGSFRLEFLKHAMAAERVAIAV